MFTFVILVQASKNGDRGKSDMSRLGITNYFVNTTITALQASEWETLFQRLACYAQSSWWSSCFAVRVGVDAMLHLLADTSIFVALPNECLCQLTGEPVVHKVLTHRELTAFQTFQKQGEKRTAPNSDANERPKKRPRLHESIACDPKHLKVKSAGTLQYVLSVSRCYIRLYDASAGILLPMSRLYEYAFFTVGHVEFLVLTRSSWDCHPNVSGKNDIFHFTITY